MTPDTPEKLWERYIALKFTGTHAPGIEAEKRAVLAIATERCRAAVEEERAEIKTYCLTRQDLIDGGLAYENFAGLPELRRVADYIDIRSRGTPTASSEGEGQSEDS